MEQIRLFIFSPDKLTLCPPAFLSNLLLLSKSFHNGFNFFLLFSGDLQTGLIHKNLFCFSRFQIVLRLFNPTRWPHKLAILGSAVLKWATDEKYLPSIENLWKSLTMFTCSCWKSWKSLPQWIPTAARTTCTPFQLSSIVYIIMSLIDVDMCWTLWPGKKVFFLANPLRMNLIQCHDKIRANVDRIWEPGEDQASTLPSCSLPKAGGSRGEAESPNRPHGPQSLDAHPPKWHGEHCKRLWCCF